MKLLSVILSATSLMCATTTLSADKKDAIHHTDTQCKCKSECSDSPIVVAYVTAWSECMPDVSLMTHINYAFGHVAPTFDKVRIANPDRLRSIVALRRDNPALKIMLSIGGWGSGNFSEMAADATLRARFAADCARVAKEYDLDGIDIDWEYPTAGKGAGISESVDDTANYTLLMRDLRKALGPDRLLTLAGVWNANYISFRDILPYVDFVNIMSYDMTSASKGYPHNPLYPSAVAGSRTVSAALQAHIDAGIPANKIVLGLPFYGRGVAPYPDYMDYKDTQILPGTKEVWDDEAKSVYMVSETDGNVLMGFENSRSLAEKLHFIRAHRLRGAMYWEYCGGGDGPSRQVADSILGR